MAIKPKCYRCKVELKEWGGIILSPPLKDDLIRKFHLCAKCFFIVLHELRNKVLTAEEKEVET
jgi:hypothetical protein